jgi:hypothetical protein
MFVDRIDLRCPRSANSGGNQGGATPERDRRSTREAEGVARVARQQEHVQRVSWSVLEACEAAVDRLRALVLARDEEGPGGDLRRHPGFASAGRSARPGHGKNARRNHSPAAPSPPMQAPASSKSRSVGPSGQDLLYARSQGRRYGSYQRVSRFVVESNQVVHGPPTFEAQRSPGGSIRGDSPAPGRRRVARRRGHNKTPEGTTGSAPSPQMQAPAASRLRSVGPSGQVELYVPGAVLEQQVIHEFRRSAAAPKHVVHAHSTGLCPGAPVPWAGSMARFSRFRAVHRRRPRAGRWAGSRSADRVARPRPGPASSPPPAARPVAGRPSPRVPDRSR